MALTKYQSAALGYQAADILGPLDQWTWRCHEASLKIVREATFECRVARGTCKGVGSQHSWVVVGDDCYARDATIIDPTLWQHADDVEGVWIGTLADGRHTPHGSGSIWAWGRPNEAVPGQEMELTPRKPWSAEAQMFLDLLGPLDLEGWRQLAHAPVGNWPAGEIIDAICESGLDGAVPVDIVGMLTDRNPGGLYLAA